MSRPWPESMVGQVLTIRGATHLCLAAGEDALLLLQLARCDGALFRRGDPVQYIVAHGPCLHGDELVIPCWDTKKQRACQHPCRRWQTRCGPCWEAAPRAGA